MPNETQKKMPMTETHTLKQMCTHDGIIFDPLSIVKTDFKEKMEKEKMPEEDVIKWVYL